MTKDPNVSVVIPAWNVAPYLSRAVESALAQSDAGKIEIIIIDDCSTDTTPVVMEELARVFPEIRLLKNPRNSGPGYSRNVGITAARGEWIAMLDADDAFAPGRLKKLIEVAEQEGFEALSDLPIFFDLAASQVAPEQLKASGGVMRVSLANLFKPDPETDLDLGLMKPIFHHTLVERGLLRYPDHMRHAEDHRLYVELVRAGVVFGLLLEAYYVFSTRIGAISKAYSPGSRTRVNYRDVARQSADFARELAASGELTLEIAELLKMRERRSLRLNTIYGWTTLRTGDRARFLSWVRQDPRNSLDVFRVVIKKVFGHRGLP